MSSSSRISRALREAPIIEIDQSSKVILMSDTHRGDASYADEFAQNSNIFSHALKHYYKHGFTYIELGDGNELWENRFFKSLYTVHKNIFKLLKQFYDSNRLYLIWGNHDMIYKNPDVVKAHYAQIKDDKSDEMVDFMPNLNYHEAIQLYYKEADKHILCLHGHQADFNNYVLWKFNRFFVRMLWRPLQILGFYDPTSPAKNNFTLNKVETKIKDWIQKHNNHMIVAGHTHKPRFPKVNSIPFFNAGSAVHPRSITGIEIDSGKILLVKWYISTTDEGTLQVVKDILEGPKNLEDYLC